MNGDKPRRFSLPEAFFLSFHSKPFYRDVAANWRTAGPLFLLLVLSLSWIPTIIGVYGNWSKFTKTQAPLLLDQMPALSISEGVVTANPPGPSYITDDTGKALAIIDTSGTITSLENMGAVLLLTRTQLFFRKSPTETRIISVSEVKRFDLDRAKLERWIHLVSIWAPPALFVLFLLLSATYRFLQAVIYAAVGLWFAKRAQLTIPYAASVRIALIGLYPTIVLKTALEMGGATFYYGWILLIIGLAYVRFGIRACRPEEPEKLGAAAGGAQSQNQAVDGAGSV